MKRLLLLLFVLLAGCQTTPKKTIVVPSATPEMLIQRPTRKPVYTPTVTDFMLTVTAILYEESIATPTRGYHEPQNLTAPTSACRIKGNVSAQKNTKIYHCPNFPSYATTDVNTYEGDRWFCTESEAIAAGFRKPANVSGPCIP